MPALRPRSLRAQVTADLREEPAKQGCDVFGTPVSDDVAPQEDVVLSAGVFRRRPFMAATATRELETRQLVGRARTVKTSAAVVLGAVLLALLAVPVETIRHGDPVGGAQYTSVGAIMDSDGHVLCTCTMIGPFVVLTAAQCLLA